MITTEQHNYLVSVFKSRMFNQDVKPTTKKYIDLQCEFFMGAMALLDMGKEETSMSPSIYVDILRGEVIKPLKD